jgi:hypothetical protein
MLRGGSYNNNARNCRSAYRNNNDARNLNDNVGFRVVVSASTPDWQSRTEEISAERPDRESSGRSGDAGDCIRK